MSSAAARPGTSRRSRFAATRATQTGVRRPSCAPVRPPEPVSRRRLIRIGAVAIAAAVLVALALRAAGAMTAETALELEAIMGLLVWLIVWRRIRTELLPRPPSTREP